MISRLSIYLEDLKARNYSAITIKKQEYSLRRLMEWLGERGISEPHEVTRSILERYRRQLSRMVKPDGKTLSPKTTCQHIYAIRVFFRWLSRNNHILYNPAADLESPKIGQSLPKYVLNVEEAEQVLNSVRPNTPLKLRNRVILEVLYATGIRRMELSKLKLEDIDFSRGTLKIREGKGKKDRVVPLGERASSWLQKYLEDSRPDLVAGPDQEFVFVNRRGGPIGRTYLTELVRDQVAASGITKPGACHLLRHTMATLMLEGGADVRYVQEMLGHSRLDTTAIYTRISIQKLKEVHQKTHPGANLPRIFHQKS